MAGDAGDDEGSGKQDVGYQSVTELIYAIYPDALDRGIPLDTFWGSSVQEVLAMMESVDRQKRQAVKEAVQGYFAAADVIANRVGIVFTDKKKRKDSDYVQPWDLYPRLFEIEKLDAEEAAREKGLAEQKAVMNAYAARWNAKRRRDNG